MVNNTIYFLKGPKFQYIYGASENAMIRTGNHKGVFDKLFRNWFWSSQKLFISSIWFFFLLKLRQRIN